MSGITEKLLWHMTLFFLFDFFIYLSLAFSCDYFTTKFYLSIILNKTILDLYSSRISCCTFILLSIILNKTIFFSILYSDLLVTCINFLLPDNILISHYLITLSVSVT